MMWGETRSFLMPKPVNMPTVPWVWQGWASIPIKGLVVTRLIGCKKVWAYHLTMKKPKTMPKQRYAIADGQIWHKPLAQWTIKISSNRYGNIGLPKPTNWAALASSVNKPISYLVNWRKPMTIMDCSPKTNWGSVLTDCRLIHR